LQIGISAADLHRLYPIRALAAHGRRLVVVDDSEVDDDLVRDMTEVLTSFCVRLYGRRSARSRALWAVACAERCGAGVE